MKYIKNFSVVLNLLLLVSVLIFVQNLTAQTKTGYEVITDKDQLKAVVPSSFYFAGLSAGTQMRNAAAGKLGEKRFVLAGLVDVSGYSTDIQGFYEGFLITDSPVKFGDQDLGTGAYGIGFSKDGKANLYDLSGSKLLSTATTTDPEMKRPRPLQMTADEQGIRLYRGRDYILIAPR